MIGVPQSDALKRFSIEETGLVEKSGPSSYSRYIVIDSAIFSGLKIFINNNFSKAESLIPKLQGID